MKREKSWKFVFGFALGLACLLAIAAQAPQIFQTIKVMNGLYVDDIFDTAGANGIAQSAIATQSYVGDGLAGKADGADLTTHTGDTANPHAVTKTQVGLSAVLNALQLYADGSDLGAVQGAVVYHDGAQWQALAPGDSGKFLKTQGAAANPLWDTPAGSGDVNGPAGGTAQYMAAVFSDTTGKLIAASQYYTDASGNLDLPAGAAYKIDGTAHTHDYQALAVPTAAGNIARLNIAGQVYDGDMTIAQGATASALVQRDIDAAVTAAYFYGDGSNLTGISTSTAFVDLTDVTASAPASVLDNNRSIEMYYNTDGGGIADFRPSVNPSYTGWYRHTEAFTRASDSSFTVTDSATAAEMLKVGRPLRYADTVGTWSYGLVTAYSAGTVTLAGAPMTTSFDTYLEFGDMSKVSQVSFTIPGIYGDGTGDLLAADANAYFQWDAGKAYLVTFKGVHKTVDTGAEPKINVKVNAAAVSTDDTNAGIQLGATATWVSNSATGINTSNYAISRGQNMEINCSVAGGTGDASDLTVQATFVFE